MGRNPCCSKEGLNRGAWTAMEDKILKEYVRIHGEGKWRSVPKRAGLKRCGKSCRLRWLNYLRPDIKRGNISNDEEELIIRLHRLLGNRWSLIAGRLPGRTDNEIKNYWNTNIGKKVQGHSNPTFKQRPSNQARGNLIPAKELATSAAPLKAIIGSGVIRTKATRCTKVVLTSGPQDQTSDDHDHQLDIKPHDHGHKPSITLGDHHEDSADFSKLNLEENINFSNFLEDFEMDENFLSDFLDTDFSQLPCFESSVGDSIISNCTSGDKDQTSLTCHQRRTTSSTLLVPEEETMHGSDFQPMAPLTESELDWI